MHLTKLQLKAVQLLLPEMSLEEARFTLLRLVLQTDGQLMIERLDGSMAVLIYISSTILMLRDLVSGQTK